MEDDPMRALTIINRDDHRCKEWINDPASRILLLIVGWGWGAIGR